MFCIQEFLKVSASSLPSRENIFGYENLRVRLVMSAGSLKAAMWEDKDATVSAADLDGVQPDPVLPPLAKLLAEGQLAQSKEDFRREAGKEEAAFKPMGEKIIEFTDKEGVEMFGMTFSASFNVV